MSIETCPVSGCDLRGEEIKREHLEAGYYGPWKPEDGSRYYSKVIGMEIRGVYDGVLFWICPVCGECWHRFTDRFMQARAEPEMAEYRKRHSEPISGA